MYESIIDNAQSTGVMIAFTVPPNAARGILPSPGDLPAGSEVMPDDQMHLTLVYLGKVIDQAYSRADLEMALSAFAERRPPLVGQVNGLGQFSTGDDGMYPLYANFDSPQLPAFRQDLIAALGAAGVIVDETHGFTPHITLAYVPVGETPQVNVSDKQVTFDSIELAWGEDVVSYPLKGKTMEAQIQVREIKDDRLVRSLREAPLAVTAHDGGGFLLSGVVIAEGVSANGNNYTLEALQTGQDVFIGRPIYADHPSRSEESDRPERSVRDLVGRLSNDPGDFWVEANGNGVNVLRFQNAKLSKTADWLATMIQEGIAGDMSINAMGSGEERDGMFCVDAFTEATSLDFVTQAAAGGRGELESAPNLKTMTVAQLASVRPDLVDALAARERNKAYGEKAELIAATQELYLERALNAAGLIGKDREAIRRLVEAQLAEQQAPPEAAPKPEGDEEEPEPPPKTMSLDQFLESPAATDINVASFREWLGDDAEQELTSDQWVEKVAQWKEAEGEQAPPESEPEPVEEVDREAVVTFVCENLIALAAASPNSDHVEIAEALADRYMVHDDDGYAPQWLIQASRQVVEGLMLEEIGQGQVPTVEALAHRVLQQLREVDAKSDQRTFEYVSDRYGSGSMAISPAQFLADVADLGWDVELSWHTDGEGGEWYTDQHGETVLELTESHRPKRMTTSGRIVVEGRRRPVREQVDVMADIVALSSGTLATLTGFNRYDQLDPVHQAFVAFVRQKGPEQFPNWQAAWKEFAQVHSSEWPNPRLEALREAAWKAIDMTGSKVIDWTVMAYDEQEARDLFELQFGQSPNPGAYQRWADAGKLVFEITNPMDFLAAYRRRVRPLRAAEGNYVTLASWMDKAAMRDVSERDAFWVWVGQQWPDLDLRNDTLAEGEWIQLHADWAAGRMASRRASYRPYIPAYRQYRERVSRLSREVMYGGWEPALTKREMQEFVALGAYAVDGNVAIPNPDYPDFPEANPPMYKLGLVMPNDPYSEAWIMQASRRPRPVRAAPGLNWQENPPGSGRYQAHYGGWVANVYHDVDQWVCELSREQTPNIADYGQEGFMDPQSAQAWAESTMQQVLGGRPVRRESRRATYRRILEQGNIANLATHLAHEYGPADEGFFTRCMAASELTDYPEENRSAICARAHKEFIGKWPGEEARRPVQESVEATIRQALLQIMDASEASGCQVYKGLDYDGVRQAYGWWYKLFNRQPVYLGSSVQEALDIIDSIASAREYASYRQHRRAEAQRAEAQRAAMSRRPVREQGNETVPEPPGTIAPASAELEPGDPAVIELPPDAAALPEEAQMVWLETYVAYLDSGEEAAMHRAWTAVYDDGWEQDQSGRWVQTGSMENVAISDQSGEVQDIMSMPEGYRRYQAGYPHSRRVKAAYVVMAQRGNELPIFMDRADVIEVARSMQAEAQIAAGPEYRVWIEDESGNVVESRRRSYPKSHRLRAQYSLGEWETLAHQRVENSPILQQYSDVIFYDWPEGEEHFEWVATALETEIVDWAEAVKMNEARRSLRRAPRPGQHPHLRPAREQEDKEPPQEPKEEIPEPPPDEGLTLAEFTKAAELEDADGFETWLADAGEDQGQKMSKEDWQSLYDEYQADKKPPEEPGEETPESPAITEEAIRQMVERQVTTIRAQKAAEVNERLVMGMGGGSSASTGGMSDDEFREAFSGLTNDPTVLDRLVETRRGR